VSSGEGQAIRKPACQKRRATRGQMPAVVLQRLALIINGDAIILLT
jgi:hypothetical protein